VNGLRDLREAVSEYLERTQGLRFDPDDIVVGPGSKELLFLLQVVQAGDLLIPTPGWVSYEPQARILGRRPVLLLTSADDDYQLDPQLLDSTLEREGERPRILVLNYPSNPTGRSLDAAHLSGIAAVAAKHRMILVSDEIYGPLQYDGGHRSIASSYPQGTIVSTGLSKWCGAGGWRLGLMAFPPSLRPLRDAMVAVASETFTSTSAPIQYAAVAAFRGDAVLDRYLVECRQVLARILRWSCQTMREYGLIVPEPTAAFYLFPDFERHRSALLARGLGTSPALARALLDETGIAALPGEVFGRDPSELTMRFSVIDFDGGAALQAAGDAVDESFLRVMCPRVVRGLEVLGAWLRGLRRATRP
jgi:aspartate aminotransferase